MKQRDFHSFSVAYVTRAQWVCSKAENSHCEALRAHLEIRRSTCVRIKIAVLLLQNDRLQLQGHVFCNCKHVFCSDNFTFTAVKIGTILK